MFLKRNWYAQKSLLHGLSCVFAYKMVFMCVHIIFYTNGTILYMLLRKLCFYSTMCFWDFSMLIHGNLIHCFEFWIPFQWIKTPHFMYWQVVQILQLPLNWGACRRMLESHTERGYSLKLRFPALSAAQFSSPFSAGLGVSSLACWCSHTALSCLLINGIRRQSK